MSDKCAVYQSDHKYSYDAYKSDKEESVFSCSCGEILQEAEDSTAGC